MTKTIVKLGIPYANVKACIPAAVLVAVNVTNLFGPTVQLFAVVALLFVFSGHLKLEMGRSWVWVLYFLVCIAVGILAYGPHQAVIKAGKLILFVGASFLTVRGAHDGNRFPALLALRAFLVLCFLNVGYAIAVGESVFRAGFLIEFSIYSSYTIAILVYLARPELKVYDRVLAYSFLALCGSTMGMLLLIAAEFVGRKFRPRTIVALVASLPIGLWALNLLMNIRGKALSLDYLATSDRANLLMTFWDTTLHSLTFVQWVFGVGVGSPLHHFLTPNSGFNEYLLDLGEDGIYSFCLHNEVLRILCDFGLVGLFIVVARLTTVCSKPVLLLLAIGMITNSYLYSFSGALIASGLFNPKPLEPGYD
ncbi:MAG: hypothetical protein CMO55_23980 [Verrucomicrobiales bacterium]|nr:hypothetical protein [Verrucomicrobiales bacterium]